MMSSPDFFGLPTVVGSFPHTEHRPLIGRLFDSLPGMPAWPQLPARDWRESMYVQYCEGLPGAVVDGVAQRLYFRADEAFHLGLEPFYQAVIEGNPEPFAVSRDYALGLHAFLDELRRRGGERPAWVKGQVTGPFSFAMTVTDENKRALAYTPELWEVAVRGMALKARWMARRLREVAAGALVVLDEPYLCSFGSAFLNVPREQVVEAIDGAAQAVHAEGALAGVHCCGNTDWSLVLETGVDVINLDAHDYFQGLPLYPAELQAFFARGGTVAWGIVPASAAAAELGAAALLAELDERVEQLERKGIDRRLVFRRSLLTPSCGLGSQPVETAERVLEQVVEVAARLREREQFS